MILHTINQSPFTHHRADDCLAFCRPGDHVVLLENGIYCLQHKILAALISAGVTVSVIEADTKARGISPDSQAALIDYDDFVSLCVTADKVVSW